MNNIFTSSFKDHSLFSHKIGLMISLLTIAIGGSWQPVQAATVNPSLRQKSIEWQREVMIAQNTNPSGGDNLAIVEKLLKEIDSAATKRNLEKLMDFYSPNFTHGDGLNSEDVRKSLMTLWQKYPLLQYRTTLESWKSEGDTIIAETVTQINGLASAKSNNLTMKATVKSRQRIEGGKIIYQEILSEKTLLTAGSEPPEIDVILPEKVKVGQEYNFDAIVTEPLGNDFLLGTALSEPVQVDKYLNPTPVQLEMLTSGGLFKVGRAPLIPGNHWISAVIVRAGGMTMVTQRLQVVK